MRARTVVHRGRVPAVPLRFGLLGMRQRQHVSGLLHRGRRYHLLARGNALPVTSDRFGVDATAEGRASRADGTADSQAAGRDARLTLVDDEATCSVDTAQSIAATAGDGRPAA